MRQRNDTEILDAVHAYMFGSEHPDLVGYRTQSLTRDLANMNRFMVNVRNLCDLGQIYDKDVLDVGCGLAWHSLAVSMVGNNRVTALDILPSMTEAAAECVQYLTAKGVDFKLTPKNGDICNIELPDASFDVIYSIEAIEHVHNIEAMFTSCARLLRPGGRLIIKNDCNLLNRRAAGELMGMWQKRESSWEWANYLRSIRPVEHADARPFELMRREIVTAANPSLPEPIVERIVSGTKGALKKDIERIARAGGEGLASLPDPGLDWCRNPVTGEFAERLFDPYSLESILKSAGFRASVFHAFRRWPLHTLNKIRFHPLNVLLFNVKQDFTIYAEKSA